MCFYYYRIYGYDDGIGKNSEEYSPASYHDHSQFWQWFDPRSQCWRNIWKYIAYPTNEYIHVVNFKITSKTQIFQNLKLFCFSMMSDVKRFLFNHKYHKICVSSFQTRLKSKPTPITDSTPICTIWKSIHEKEKFCTFNIQ